MNLLDAALPRRARRAVFWVYALVLFTLTHYPRLDLKVPGIERPDLIVHFTCFGTWYLLLFASRYFEGGRVRRLVTPWVVAVAYAAFDEGLQLIPAIQRHAAWDDLAANIGGITLGLLGAWAWLEAVRRFNRGQDR